MRDLPIFDTGRCVAERPETLALQQRQLEAGKRDVQMFPEGTPELPLPRGLDRHHNARGAYHFRSDKISADAIDALSALGRENEFLNLGPYSKSEIATRARRGERGLCIIEVTPEGIELRSAVGTVETAADQVAYFERTKEAGNAIVLRELADVIEYRKRAA